MTYKAAVFVDAIEGSGGIISTIADRVGCSWNTAKHYIENYASVQKAYQDECERVIDKAESAVLQNIEIALKVQERNKQADTSDAKWYLSRKAKHRGYVERQEVQHEGGSDPVKVQIVEVVKHE